MNRSGRRQKATKNQQKLSEAKWREWNHTILSLFANIWLITLVVELLLFLFYKPTEACGRLDYFYSFIAKPSGWELLALGVFWLVFTKLTRIYSRRLMSFYTIVLVSVFAGITACVHTSVGLMPMVLILPMVMTPLYKETMMTLLQAVVMVGVYIADCLYFIPNSIYMPSSNRMVEISVFIGGIIVTYTVLRKVNETVVLDEERSRRDSLTHLYNHETFYEQLEHCRLQYEKTGTAFTVMIADIDDFKLINDTFGHAFGDEVIRYVAELFLKLGSRVGVCARYGGEEFTMIMQETEKKAVAWKAEEIRREFEEHAFHTTQGEKHFTISLGVAICDKVYPNASTFFEQADKALYQAKRTGKNRVVIQEPTA